MEHKLLTATALVLATGLGVAACGGSSSSAPAASSTSQPPAAVQTTQAPPAVNYQQQYLHDTAAANADVTQVNADSNATFTSPNVIKLGNDVQIVGRSLLQQSWPAKAQADVHTLAQDAMAVNTAIKEQDYSGLQSDVEAMGAQAQVVRVDLGLPAGR